MTPTLKQTLRSRLHHPSYLFVFLLVVLFVVKTLVLLDYSLHYTSNDALIFWQGATDYAKGIFHEPYFYGQNYNPMLEAVLAVPLLKMGVPVEIALPVISSMIGVFPFVFIASVLFRRQNYLSSYTFLIIALSLPTEYDILTSLTRGFTSGLFCCSFLIYPLLHPRRKSSFYLLGFIGSFAFWFNPNSLVFSLAVCVYLFLFNFKTFSFYLRTLIAIVPALICIYFANSFYVNNPSYLTHAMGTMDFNFELLWEALQHMDQFFRHLTPVVWSGNWLVLLVILILGILLIRRDWQKGVSILAAILLIIFSLGVPKIHDDIGVLFLSSVRMFLAVPLLLGLALYWINPQPKNLTTWNWAIIVLVLFVGIRKISTYSSCIDKQTETTNFGPIAIKNLDELTQKCDELKELTKTYNVDLVVFIADWRHGVAEIGHYNYACPVLQENTMNTVMNVYERRTWVFNNEKNKIRKNLLLYNPNLKDIEEIKQKMDCTIIQKSPHLLLIENNDKSLIEIAELFGFLYQRHTYY